MLQVEGMEGLVHITICTEEKVYEEKRMICGI